MSIFPFHHHLGSLFSEPHQRCQVHSHVVIIYLYDEFLIFLRTQNVYSNVLLLIVFIYSQSDFWLGSYVDIKSTTQ